MVTFPMTPGSFQPGHWLFGLARTACILAVAAVLTALWTGPAGATGQALPSSSFGRPGAPSSSNALTRCGQYRVPVGQLSVATNGTLFYVDREHGQIDEATPEGSHIVLSSPDGTAAPNRSIAGLGGLSIADHAIWFTAGNALYEASLNGRDVRRAGSTSGAVDLDVLPDGTSPRSPRRKPAESA